MRDTIFVPEAVGSTISQSGSGPAILSTSVREIGAEQTLELIRPILEQFGVRRVVDLTLKGVPSCPVFQVTRADMRSDYFNAGKGFSRVESMVSGLMEAIEVQCFERADPVLLHSHGQVMQQNGRILPASSLLEDEPGYGGDLVRGFDHVRQETVWLPAQCVFRELSGGHTEASCNGIASGNSVQDALCHALCELAERHALEAFYRMGASLPLERVAAPPGVSVMTQCLHELRGQDITADFLLVASQGIPVFICFLDIPLSGRQRGVVQGYGAHLNPEIAMCRALAEAIQMLALCPAQPDGSDAAEEVDRHAQVIMTSKQSASLAPESIARQRSVDRDMLIRLSERVELVDYEYSSVHDNVPSPEATVHPATTLQHILDSLAGMGFPQVFSCLISPPTLPVVVVKSFCPGLKSIPGL